MNEREIFIAALEKDSPEDRRHFLDLACQDAAALRRRVEELLEVHARAGSYLNRPLAAPLLTGDYAQAGEGPPEAGEPKAGSGEGAGDAIGPYTLLEQVGEGGMGTVWMAQQTDPVRRAVALKVIKPGMGSGQVIARFEAERQALALMDHPNIARVLDAGTSGSGRPFFVMELVKGMPLTKYCDEHRLTPRERLKLFVEVCRGVQHAHQKGVIHRDIKPSNVLVALYDGKPVPKVIDFGVAKAIGQELTEHTLVTGIGTVVGTLEYMSPEQAELTLLDIDTRTDVYSLGALLYELLTGTTPLESKRLRGVGTLEVLRRIREEEPPRPSTRLSTTAELPSVAASRGLEPRKLCALVKGELDWIVMKALEKDRDRRYETANGLAHDIERYLADEPVLACPPSPWYQLRKFVRRNQGPALAVCLTVLALLAGIVGTTLGLIEARRQAHLAHQAEVAATEDRDAAVLAETNNRVVREFLVTHILMVARPSGEPHGLGIDVTVTQALVAAEGEIGRVFAGQPRAEASAREAIGVTWRNQGRLRRAEPHFVRACELWESELGPDAREALLARHRLGELLTQMGRYPQAVAMLGDVVRRMKAALGADHADTLAALSDLATAHFTAGDRKRARTLLAEVLRLRKGHRQPERALQLIQYASAWTSQAPEQLDAGVATRRETVQALQAELGPEHPDTLVARNNLAVDLMIAGRPAEAIRTWEEILPRQRSRPGAHHSDTLTTVANLGWAYTYYVTPGKAVPLLEQAWDKRKVLLGTTHPDTLTSMLHLGIAYLREGKRPRAVALLEEAVKLHQARFGPDHIDTTHSMSTLAHAYLNSGKVPEAIALAEKVLRRQQTCVGPAHPDTLSTQLFLARAHQRAGNRDRLLLLLEERYRLSRFKWGEEHLHTLTCQHDLAVGFRECGQHDRAIPLLEAVAKLRAARLGPHAPSALASRQEMVRAWTERAQIAVARQQWDRACADFARLHEEGAADLEGAVAYAGALLLAGDPDSYRRLRARLGEDADRLRCLNQPGRRSYLLARIGLLSPVADKEAGRLTALAEKALSAGPKMAWYLHTLGLAHYRAGRSDEAVRRLEESLRIAPEWSARPVNWLVLALSHQRLGHAAEAREWLTRATQASDNQPLGKSLSQATRGMHAHDWVAYLILRREAEALIGKSGK
jgi:serine/threonine protein kinase/tetratricopeptide (TPR) repeat protein